MLRASISAAAGAGLACPGMWSTFVSLRTKGREGLTFTDSSHCFEADKGRHLRDLSRFSKHKDVEVPLFSFDDHCPVSGLRRPFLPSLPHADG